MARTIQQDTTQSPALLQRLVERITIALEGKPQKGTIPALDGVRALACLAVVAFHISLMTTSDTPLWFPHNTSPLITAVAFAGDTGVTLFFVLSGFLLFRPYAKALLFPDTDWPSIRRFYLHRALRILPVYYLSVIAMAIFFAPGYLHFDHLPQWLLFLTLFMDSSARTYKQINGPLWSLAVEWQFYLVLPFLALGMSLLVRRFSTLTRRLGFLFLCLGLLIAWGIGTRSLGLYLTSHPNDSFLLPRSLMNNVLPFIYGPPIAGLHGKFMEDFGIGMLASTCYTLAVYQSEESTFRVMMHKFSSWLFVTGISWLLIMALWKLNASPMHMAPIFDPVNKIYDNVGEFGFAVGYGLCVIAVLFGTSWLKSPFEWHPLRWIGILSYSLYMWHLPLLKSFSDHVIAPLQGSGPNAVLYGMYWSWVLILIIPLTFAIFLLIEKPGMGLIKRFRFATRKG